MIKDHFNYQSEKLSQARSALLAPHPLGEENGFASAFMYCVRGFHQFDTARVHSESAIEWIETIKRLIDTSSVEDKTGEGTYVHRARLMSLEEKQQFSDAVDNLASWFDCEFWSGR